MWLQRIIFGAAFIFILGLLAQSYNEIQAIKETQESNKQIHNENKEMIKCLNETKDMIIANSDRLKKCEETLQNNTEMLKETKEVHTSTKHMIQAIKETHESNKQIHNENKEMIKCLNETKDMIIANSDRLKKCEETLQNNTEMLKEMIQCKLGDREQKRTLKIFVYGKDNALISCRPTSAA